MKPTKKFYIAQFKLRVFDYLLAINATTGKPNRAIFTASQYNVAKGFVYQWIKERNVLKATNKTKISFKYGKPK